MGNEKKCSEIKKHCGSVEDLKEYLKKKARNHNHYKYYGRIERIFQIVKDKKLYLVDGKDWNDVTDRNNFIKSNPDYVNFGKCFSFAKDESVAMWMLYGGVFHSNAMIDFRKSDMNRIVDVTKVSLGFFDKKQNDKFVAIKSIAKPDFDIFLIDIVYYNKDRKYIKRSNEDCCGIEADFIEKLGVCCKTFSWSYESECRLIVSVKKDIIPDNCKAIEINLEGIDVSKSLNNVYYCPNYRGIEIEGFKKSVLDGEIDFNLI